MGEVMVVRARLRVGSARDRRLTGWCGLGARHGRRVPGSAPFPGVRAGGLSGMAPPMPHASPGRFHGPGVMRIRTAESDAVKVGPHVLSAPTRGCAVSANSMLRAVIARTPCG